MKLSVCMICKNEEKNLYRALNSIKDIAYEIIIVDTGSTDNSIKIAKDFNAKVIEIKWEDNFSLARNLSIKDAKGDYILILDCDEEIDFKNRTTLVKVLNDYPNFKGFYTKIVNINYKEEASYGIVFRIFKNNKSFKFEGAIHEQILPSILKSYSSTDILATDIEIIHHGYKESNYDVNKGLRNLKILQSIDEKSKDGYYYYNLGNEYIRLYRDYDAIKAFNNSIKLSDTASMYFPYLLINYIRLLIKLCNFEDAYALFKRFIDIFPDFKELNFCGFVISYNLKKYKESKDYLQKYKNINLDFSFYPINNIEKDYNLKLMEETLLKEIFIEENPPYEGSLPLIIGIFNTESNHNLSNTLSSIKKINCNKVIFSKSPLTNLASLQEKYDFEISYSSPLELNYNLDTILSKLLLYKEGRYILLLKSSEEITYIGLLNLQQMIISSISEAALLLPIIEDWDKTVSKEVRFINKSTSLSTIKYKLNSGELFEVDIPIISF